MDTHIKISKTTDKVKSVCIAVFLVVVFFVSISMLGINISSFSRFGNADKVLSKLIVVNFSNLPAILEGMLTSVLIAITALAIGIIISVILSFLAADNTSPSKILSAFIKGSFAIIRAVPALVWILMVVASIGFGNTGGMVGLIFPTTGYLVKSFTANIESQGYNIIEAMRTTGASWFIVITKGLAPSLIKPFTSWIAIRLEGNIAESISLGMVGVGGIGSILMKALGKYDYATVSTIILVIFISLFTVELLVAKLKKSI